MAILVLGLDDGEHIELPYSFGEDYVGDEAALLALRLFKDMVVYSKIAPEIEDIPGEDELDLDMVEQRLIMVSLRRCEWVQKDAAALLGITPRSLSYKIKMHNIRPPRGMGKGWHANKQAW